MGPDDRLCIECGTLNRDLIPVGLDRMQYAGNAAAYLVGGTRLVNGCHYRKQPALSP